MSSYVDFNFCELSPTPIRFDKTKFLAGDEEQVELYKKAKAPHKHSFLTYEQISTKKYNYSRYVPNGCMFIDFDNIEEAKIMYNIILSVKLRCLILETQHGYHFLFRMPDFYDKETTSCTNWFGYKFDCKGCETDEIAKQPIQIMRVCGMDRKEVMSWDLDAGAIIPESINIETLDVLPYWLWGKKKSSELYKKGKTGSKKEPTHDPYTLKDNPFTQLMKMTEGSRHNHIFSRCSYFAVSNGFTIEEFKEIIQAIHDVFLVKTGTPMTESDLFGDLEKRWDEYIALLEGDDKRVYDASKRVWLEVKGKKDEKIDERRAAEYLFTEFDFYGNNRKPNGTFDSLLYRNFDGPYEYATDITVFRESLRVYSEQNFKDIFFKEMEVQLMQMCAANNKVVVRNDKYVIVKNKVLSCITGDAYDFEWLGKKPPTDVVFKWNWQPESWVADHELDLGKQITEFIAQLSRNSSGKIQPEVEQWLWIIAGASMIPANQLQKIVILSGGGQNGKSLYTSLIRLCLGSEMFNESKIFDSSPHDGFWGEDLDKGVLCVIDDLNRVYSKDAFSYIKGAITGTDSVVINEKFKAKRRLDILPQIIACTNFDFELYDKSEGMKRRVLILPTEYHVPDRLKDIDLQHKLVLNTTSKADVAEYKMSEDSFNRKGVKVMNMWTDEKGVLDSLEDGSLCWFANKARYMYMHWLLGDITTSSSKEMDERFESAFSGGYEDEILYFLEWYIVECKKSIWIRDLYVEYINWHNDMATGESLANERIFSRYIGKSIRALQEKGERIELKKAKNDKGMTMNKLFIYEDEVIL